MRKTIRKILLILTVMVLSVSFVGCSFFEATNKNNNKTPTNPKPVATLTNVVFNTKTESEREYDRVKAVESVERSVVAIKMELEQSASYGSGVIVDINSQDEDGKILDGENEFYIITCHHVISSCGNITVYVPDKECRNMGDDNYNEDFVFTGKIGDEIYLEEAVTLVGGDKESDIAVLKLDITGSKITKDDIVKAKAPSSDYQVKRGEDVFAIGNPSGTLPGTVSNGIVSYVDREVSIDSVGVMNLMQIDVQINHGNSGGGLFNYYGELVGITNAGSEAYDGINYAIPFKNVYTSVDNGFVAISKQLVGTATATNYGYVSGRWILGITVTENKDRWSSYVQVTEVIKNSNAEKAGIKAKDIIQSVEYTNAEGGKETARINATADFSAVVNEIKGYYKLGDSLKLKLERYVGNASTMVDVTLTLSVQYIFCDTGL